MQDEYLCKFSFHWLPELALQAQTSGSLAFTTIRSVQVRQTYDQKRARRNLY